MQWMDDFPYNLIGTLYEVVAKSKNVALNFL